MSIDIEKFFNRRAIAGAFAGLKQQPLYLTNTFFGDVRLTMADIVAIRKNENKLEAAPFTTRGAQPDNRDVTNDEWASYMLPLISIDTQVTPSELRELPDNESAAGLVVRKVNGLDLQVRKRIEVMSAQALFSREITFPDRKGGSTMSKIEFPIPSELTDTVDLSDPTTAEPIGKMGGLSGALSEKGFVPDVAIMNATMFGKVAKTTEYRDIVKTTIANDMSLMTQYRDQGLIFKGVFNGLDCLVYSVVDGGTNYIPDDKILIGSRQSSRNLLYYGGVSDVMQTAPAPRYVPEPVYDPRTGSVIVMVKSAPLPIMVDLDGFAILTDTGS